MSHFYGYLTGNRGDVTRTGSKTSPLFPKTTTMTIAKQILENMDKNTEIEFILQKGLQNDILG